MKNFTDYRRIKAVNGLITEQQFMGDPENIEIELVDKDDQPLNTPTNIPLTVKNGDGVILEPDPLPEEPAKELSHPSLDSDSPTPDSMITKLLNFIPQIRIVHWGTAEHPVHIASDLTYKAFGKTMDMFIETYQGYYPRVKFCDCLNIRNIEDLILDEWLQDILTTIGSLRSMVCQLDLQNQLDELSGIVGKFKYLLTLK